jgi:hypothetical protein
VPERWTAYLVTSMNFGTVAPRAYAPPIRNMPRLFTVKRVAPWRWRVTLTTREGKRFKAHYREGAHALAAVDSAIRAGYFLGYPE